jgi:protein SCO1/2
MLGSPARRSTALLVAMLGALVWAGAIAAARAPKFVGPTIAHPALAPGFALRDQRGHTVSLSGQRGKVVMVTFLYTHCPDACPLTALHIETALDSLGPRRNAVSVLAVTVDPKGDTPASVRAFVRTHGLRLPFHYLTGPPSALERIWRLYNVSAVRPGAADPDHTLYVLLLDRTGRTRVLFDSLAKPAAMTHDLRLLLG